MRWWIGLLLALPPILAPSTNGARAQDACPPGSVKISVQEVGDRILITCRCVGQRVLQGSQCVEPEQAGLSAGEVRVVTGEAFRAGAALRQYGLAKNWPSPALRRWLMSTWEATQGRYLRARDLLRNARERLSHDSIQEDYERTLDNLASQLDRILGRRPLAQPAFEPDRIRDLRRQAQREIIQASILRGQGNHSDAIRLYYDALASASQAHDSVMRQEILDVLVWTRQLKASIEEKPGELNARVRAKRDEMAAKNAWWLGVHLLEAGKGAQALPYFTEAMGHFKDRDAGMATVLTKEMAQARTDPQGGIIARSAQGLPITHYTHSKKADILFDALEYGKGDWQRSIQYLRAAAEADPSNLKIRDNLNYVMGLSTSQP